MENAKQERFILALENKEYKPEWMEFVPLRYENGQPIPSTHRYRDGNLSDAPVTCYNVYDGAQNWMGTVYPNGTYTINGETTEYKVSWLRQAVILLQENGKITR